MIGAAHAGWRGALEGVLEATLDAMEGLGARTGAVRAVVGPTISQRAYEVGPEFFDRFRDEDPDYEPLLRARRRATGCASTCRASCSHRLRSAGVGEAGWVGACTYSEPDRFFSYRRSTHARRAGLRPPDLRDPPLTGSAAGGQPGAWPANSGGSLTATLDGVQRAWYSRHATMQAIRCASGRGEG